MKVKDSFKVGDKVRYIKYSDAWDKIFKVGSIYEIELIEKGTSYPIWIRGFTLKKTFFKEHFELIPPCIELVEDNSTHMLHKQIKLMKEYTTASMRLMLDREDWHGLWDAAIDIRVLIGKLEILEKLNSNIEK